MRRKVFLCSGLLKTFSSLWWVEEDERTLVTWQSSSNATEKYANELARKSVLFNLLYPSGEALGMIKTVDEGLVGAALASSS